ncbi:MAG: hypothetical protein GYA14_09645 [Ignavibacteria bacterium]|nr:hypothetical protein [Ignavibacteria bacterium]
MCLSLRYWTGAPYRSKQEEFLRLTREDGIGVQMGIMYRTAIYDRALYEMTVIDSMNEWKVKNQTKLYNFDEYAKNDGLETEDLIRWFEPTFEKEIKAKSFSYFNPKLTQLTVAVIHFTKFRY